MTLDRTPTPGRGLTWVGAGNEHVNPGERGTFFDFDGSSDSYVVDFGSGRVFCCPAASVEVDVETPPAIVRRHRSKR